MTYIGFLISFIVFPIILLSAVMFFDRRAGDNRSHLSSKLPVGLAFLVLMVLAVLYTTPWDNYLVATRVWWYAPSLVLGVTLGWVPLEEYLFFVLQPVLGGLWLWFIRPRISHQNNDQHRVSDIRKWLFLGGFLIWITALVFLIAGESPLTYLGLELIWAMPVITLQLAFGADILWRHGRLIAMGVIPLTIYLSVSDAIAIQSGVWTINPNKSLEILLGGLLPIEELFFFLLTNIMVMFGFVLVWSTESQTRFREIWNRIKFICQEPTLGEGL
jgi:lycopene cyclase domain-containing protein